MAWVYMNMGSLYRRLSRYELSINSYQRAYKFGTPVTKLYALVGLIQLSLDKKEYTDARKYVLRGYAHAKTFDSPRGTCGLYCNIAEYYSAIGESHRSARFFHKAILLANKSGDQRIKHWAMVELGALRLQQGLEKEFDSLIQALELELTGGEDILLVAKHLNVLGIKYLDQGEYLQVVAVAEKIYNLLNSVLPSPSVNLKECYELFYKAYTALNITKSADFYFDKLNKFKEETPKKISPNLDDFPSD